MDNLIIATELNKFKEKAEKFEKVNTCIVCGISSKSHTSEMQSNCTKIMIEKIYTEESEMVTADFEEVLTQDIVILRNLSKKVRDFTREIELSVKDHVFSMPHLSTYQDGIALLCKLEVMWEQ